MKSFLNFFEQPAEDSKIVKNIREQVGVPADPEKRVSRSELKLSDSEKIHIDIGGEGANEHMGFISGFKSSININASKNQSGIPHAPIPNLVQIQSWLKNPAYPFTDGFADYITMQNAPLTDKNVREIVRCLRPGGEVGLWIDPAFKDNIEKLAQLLESKPQYDVTDEFDGSTGSPKVKIISGIKPVKALTSTTEAVASSEPTKRTSSPYKG